MRASTRGQVKATTYRRILWPTDFSPLAQTALPHVLGLASGAGAEVVLLHVLPSAAMYLIPPKMGPALGRLQREARGAAQMQLRELERQVQGPGIHAHGVLAMGVPFQQIVRAAKRLRCDLIVLATQGHAGAAHAIHGIVAEHVVRWAPCSVLTVRPPGTQRGA
jgi:nucleotide-binding universal stress UspA family protein